VTDHERPLAIANLLAAAIISNDGLSFRLQEMDEVMEGSLQVLLSRQNDETMVSFVVTDENSNLLSPSITGRLVLVADLGPPWAIRVNNWGREIEDLEGA